MKINAGFEQKDKTRIVWIIDQNLNVVRVRARYRAAFSSWSYTSVDGKSGGSHLFPYYPTVGMGRRSYYGDGPHYTTRSEAVEDLRPIVLKVMRELRKSMRKALNSQLEELRSKL